MSYLVFETDLFVTDIPDAQIDNWHNGADCAGWFFARLLREDIRDDCSPVMEDWGWFMGMEVFEGAPRMRGKGILVDLRIWQHFDHPKWVLEVAGNKRSLRWKTIGPDQIRIAEQLIEQELDVIVQADSRFSNAEWSDDHPMG